MPEQQGVPFQYATTIIAILLESSGAKMYRIRREFLESIVQHAVVCAPVPAAIHMLHDACEQLLRCVANDDIPEGVVERVQNALVQVRNLFGVDRPKPGGEAQPIPPTRKEAKPLPPIDER